MLARLEVLARQRESFGFETTLASRSFAPWLRRRVKDGYAVHLVFLSLSSADLAVARVHRRVELGGHDVPEEVVRRRYAAGLRNFFSLYRPLVSNWRVYDTGGPLPRLIATGAGDRTNAQDPGLWDSIMRQCAQPGG